MRRLVLLLLLLPLVVACGAVGSAPRSAPAGAVAPSVTVRPAVAAATVLRGWDLRRADAWAHGSVPALRALYVPGAAAGRADLAMLRAWRRRGLRVDHLRTQLLAVHLLEAGPRRYRLRVRDRIVAADAVGTAVHEGLGPGRVREHVVTLVRRHGSWLVAASRNARRQ